MPRGMDALSGSAPELAIAAVALVTLRATAAAFEAALTALGVPRAEALAANPEAGMRARTLGRLVARPESTAAAMRLFVALVSLSAGAFLAATAAALRTGPLGISMIGVLVLGALLTVGLASAGRRIGASHPEPVALGLAPVVGVLALLFAPAARARAIAPRVRGETSLLLRSSVPSMSRAISRTRTALKPPSLPGPDLDPLDHVAGPEPVHDVHAHDHAPEQRVAAVEVGLR